MFVILDLRGFPSIDPKAKEVHAVLPDDFPINHNLEDMVTPLNIPVLLKWLDLYQAEKPDLIKDVEILRKGFKEGFCLFTDEKLKPCSFKNHRSARVLPHEVIKILREEVSTGRIAGPFDQMPIEGLRVHPVGLVAKPEGRWRYIYDHSMKSDCVCIPDQNIVEMGFVNVCISKHKNTNRRR